MLNELSNGSGLIMKQIVARENYIYHTRQLFMKMLKVQSCVLYMIYPQGKPAKVLSLHDCLETLPTLQNLPQSILIRTRFKPIALFGNFQKTFLQVTATGLKPTTT